MNGRRAAWTFAGASLTASLLGYGWVGLFLAVAALLVYLLAIIDSPDILDSPDRRDARRRNRR